MIKHPFMLVALVCAGCAATHDTRRPVSAPGRPVMSGSPVPVASREGSVPHAHPVELPVPPIPPGGEPGTPGTPETPEAVLQAADDNRQDLIGYALWPPAVPDNIRRMSQLDDQTSQAVTAMQASRTPRGRYAPARVRDARQAVSAERSYIQHKGD